MSQSFKTNAALAAGYTSDQVRAYAKERYDAAVGAGYNPKEVQSEIYKQYGFSFGDLEQSEDEAKDIITDMYGMPDADTQRKMSIELESKRADNEVANQRMEAIRKAIEPTLESVSSIDNERDRAIQKALSGPDTIATAIQRMPKELPMETADGYLDAWRAGFQNSVTGLALFKPTLRLSEKAGLAEKAIAGVSQMVGDIPTIVVGGIGGAIAGAPTVIGAPVAAAGGAMALTEMTRTSLMQHYERGAIKDVVDFTQRTAETLFAGVKSATMVMPAVKAGMASRVALSGATMFGKAVTPMMAAAGAATTEVAAFTGMQSAMDTRLPTWDDFALNGIMLGGLKLGGFYTSKLRQIYSDKNLTPKTTLALAAKDKSRMEDLTSGNIKNFRNLGGDFLNLYALRRNTQIEGAEPGLGWMHTSKGLAQELAHSTNRKNGIAESTDANAFNAQEYAVAANAKRASFRTEAVREQAVKQYFEYLKEQGEAPPTFSKENAQTLWDYPTKPFMNWLQKGSFTPEGKNAKPIGPIDAIVNGSKILILNDKMLLDKSITDLAKKPIEEAQADIAKNISVAETNQTSLMSRIRTTYQMMFDRINPLNNDAPIGKQTVPYLMARLQAGADGLTMHWMKFGRTGFTKINIQGKGLAEGRPVTGKAFQEVLDMVREAKVELDPEVIKQMEPILDRIKNDSIAEFQSLINGEPGTYAGVKAELNRIKETELAEMADKYGAKSNTYKVIKGAMDKKYDTMIYEITEQSDAGWVNATPNDPLNAFRILISAKHAKDLIASNIETGLDAAAVRTVADNPTLNRIYGEALKELKSFQHALLDYKAAAGLISKTRVAQIKTEYPNFVPFQRVMEDGGPAYASGNMRLMGSQRRIIDPIESIVRATFTSLRQAEKNQSMRLIAEQYGLEKYSPKDLELGPLSEWREVMAESNNTFDNLTIEYLKGGKPVHVQVPKEIYDAAVQLDPITSHMFSSMIARGAAKTASVLRAGAILAPEFMGRNFIRDQFDAYINSQSGYIPIVDFGRGLSAVINVKTGGKLFPKMDGIYQEWLRHGGALSSYVAQDRVYTAEMIQTLQNTNNPHNSVPFTQYGIDSSARAINPLNWGRDAVSGLRHMTEFVEEGSRIGEYARARELGVSPFESAYRARELTLDYARIGASMRAMNAISVFLNAHLQGADRQIRQAISDPFGSTMRIVGGIVVPTILLSMAQQELILRDPESETAKALQEIPNWQKAAYWLFPTPACIVRLSKPFEYAPTITGPIEDFFQYLYSKDPDTSYLELLWQNDTVSNAADSFFLNPKTWMGYAMPTALRPFTEVWTNYSHFSGSAIQPPQAEKLLPPARYSPNTSQLSKAISGILYNISGAENPTLQRFIAPYAIEHLVQGYTGTLGIELLRNLSKGMEAVKLLEDPKRPDRGLSDIPFIKAFVVKFPQAGSRSVENFFKDMAVMEQRLATIKDQFKEGSVTSKTVAERAMLEGNFARFTGMRSAMSQISVAIRAANYDERLNPQEKREAIDKLYWDMITIARAGNSVIKEMKRQTKARLKGAENVNP